jgi:hypothetical protein
VVNDKNRQSSILIDIVVSIYIDSYRLFIFRSIQMISNFVSAINASLLVNNTHCNFRNFYRFPQRFELRTSNGQNSIKPWYSEVKEEDEKARRYGGW